jgi:hypothetical protein
VDAQSLSALSHRTLIDESVDWSYLKEWAAKLDVAGKPDEVSK